MPLRGKIVVIKRSGGDGTEFPLTASCLFGRKPDCDIRIQLPEVSKEHCRIDVNENKEVILTNLSSVNPTCVNGEALQQSERLKHGDVITIIGRSFRFEYPPAPTPKKRSSIGGKTGKVLQDHQALDTITTETGEKRISEVSTDPHLKDGANNDNIQRSLEKAMEVESKEDDSLLQNKTTSPFNDLYQMIKKSLDVKTPRKSTASLLQTPSSRFCTPKPGSVRKNDGKAITSIEEKSTPKKDEAKVSSGADETKGEVDSISSGTPKSVKKQRRSFQVPDTKMAGPEAQNPAKAEATSPQKSNRGTPQRFTVSEVIEQVSTETAKSPMRRRSREATPTKSAAASPKTEHLPTTSPRNSEKVKKVKEAAKKRKSGELAADLPTSQMKKKRVSFGGHLSPELFDKRLPPDSPLRKGATPRRSLGLYKPKQSLLRRASVIGLLQEFDQEHPDSPNVQSPAKMRTPSPNKSSSAKNASPKTPSGKKSPKSRSPSPKAATPAKKSPKSRSPSPKAATPAKKLPKSRSPSPKAATPAKKSPKSRSPSPKAATPAKKSPKSRSPSPKAATPAKKSPKSAASSPKAATPAKKSPKSRSPSRNNVATPGVQTPTVQGRFSVSRISTPSPTVDDAVTDQAPSATETPKLPLRRKSMKSASRKTPSMSKSAVKAMCRRSGISRVSMKGMHSWANIVKFGQPKAQVPAPAQKIVTKKTMKKPVSKPKTPARKLKDHVSTGHANSPATIVVGRAHKQKVVYPTGAAPKLVTNVAVFKKDMKMDEDLTGISEMYKTPVNERKRRSVINENSTMKTPVGALGTSVVEPSVLNTPEEPGEMMVSPLSVSSTVKDGRYNSEAVQRLLNGDEESSFISDIPAMETHSDPSEQESMDLKMTSVTTPKQKPELPDCLTGVKRIMKTPKQTVEPVEDLRGRLLKTPKQKPVQPECLTGVKRIMKTPRQKAEPVEDLRGKILKTPKQKPEQQECLTGVKRVMKTPRQKAEPVEDLRGNILKTPKQKPAQQECLTGVKRIFETPQQEAEPLEDLCEKLLETPKVLEAGGASPIVVKEVVETPAHIQESEDLSEMTDMKTPNVKSSPVVCLTGVKRIMKTPKEKSGPVEDMVGVKRLMKTPREKVEPVEENFGIKRLVKTPRLRGNAPVEDFEGLEELMQEPLPEPTGQLETNEAEDQTSPDCDKDVAKELDFAHEEPQDNLPSDVADIVPQVDIEKEADANEAVDDHLEEEPSGHNNGESSDAMETLSHVVVDENVPVEEPKVDAADNLSEIQPKLDTLDEAGSEEQPKLEAPDENASEQPQVEEAVDENMSEEQPQVETTTSNVSESNTAATDPDHEKKPVRGRRAKTVESKSAEDKQETTEDTEDPVVPAPVRGRRGKKTAATAPPAVRQTTRGRKAKTTESQDVEHTLETSASLPTKVALKPKRGRNAKKVSDDETVQEVVIEPETVQEVATEADTVQEDVIEPETVQAVATEADTIQEVVIEPETVQEVATEAEIVQEVVIEAETVQEVAIEAETVQEVAIEAETVQEAATEAEMVPAPENEQSLPVDIDHKASDSAAPLEKAALKPRRGRKAKQPEQSVPEQQDVPCTNSDDAPKPDTTKEADANEVCNDQLEAVPSGSEENKSSDDMETSPQAPATESSPEVETATEIDAAFVQKKPVRGRRGKVVESKSAEDKQEVAEHAEEPVVPAPVRGRRGKKTEAAVPPAVRQTKRGRKAKSQETNPDDQSETVEEKAVETTVVTELSTEAASDQTSPVNASKENDSAPPTEEPVVKPTRGRKAKQAPIEPPQPEPKKNEVLSDEHLMADAQCQQSVPTLGKPGRGRKTKPDAAEVAEDTVVTVETKQESQPPVRAKRGRNAKQEEKQVKDVKTTSLETTESQEPAKKSRRARKAEQDHVEQGEEASTVEVTVPEEAQAPVVEVAEDMVVTEETKQQSQPPVRSKRGRNAKQEEKLENDGETAQSQEPVKKSRRTRKAELDHDDPREDASTVEVVVPVEAEASVVAEPVKINEKAAVTAKPRRGGRKTKQDTESETSIVSAEAQEVPAVGTTDKPKRGKRGKQVTEEVEVTAEAPEEKANHEMEAEEKNNVEPDVAVHKPSRARGVKSEGSQAIPAKRARRGAIVPVEETNAESTAVVSESAPASVETAKRGRRAAAKPTTDDATVTSDQANPSEDVSGAVVEDAKTSKRSVKWKADLEVFEIPKATPVKAVRGRKTKLGDQVDTENTSKAASKTEEKDLSDKVVEVQPTKRARRGAKVADVAADQEESTSKSVEAETQSKTRRGRSAKK